MLQFDFSQSLFPENSVSILYRAISSIKLWLSSLLLVLFLFQFPEGRTGSSWASELVNWFWIFSVNCKNHLYSIVFCEVFIIKLIILTLRQIMDQTLWGTIEHSMQVKKKCYLSKRLLSSRLKAMIKIEWSLH